MTNKRKVLFHLSGSIELPIKKLDETDEQFYNEYNTVMIVGDGEYNSTYFPADEVEKAVSSFEGVPININHNDETIEDIVGYVKDVKYEDKKLYATAIFDRRTSKYGAVNGYIQSRKSANDVPNVSIGVWIDVAEEKIGKEIKTVARNLRGDHLAVVVRGACNPEDGCGIYTYPSDSFKTPYTTGWDNTQEVLKETMDEIKDKYLIEIYKTLIEHERLKNE